MSKWVVIIIFVSRRKTKDKTKYKTKDKTLGGIYK